MRAVSSHFTGFPLHARLPCDWHDLVKRPRVAIDCLSDVHVCRRDCCTAERRPILRIFNYLHSEMNIFTPGESDAQLQKPSNGRSPPGERHLSSDLFDEPHEAKTKKKKKDFCAAAARLPPLGSNKSEIKEREDGSESAALL